MSSVLTEPMSYTREFSDPFPGYQVHYFNVTYCRPVYILKCTCQKVPLTTRVYSGVLAKMYPPHEVKINSCLPPRMFNTKNSSRTSSKHFWLFMSISQRRNFRQPKFLIASLLHMPTTFSQFTSSKASPVKKIYHHIRTVSPSRISSLSSRHLISSRATIIRVQNRTGHAINNCFSFVGASFAIKPPYLEHV